MSGPKVQVCGGMVYLPLPSRCTLHPSPPYSGLCCLVAKSCLTLHDPMNYSPPALLPQDFPGKNTGVGCHFLLQGILLTQGSSPCLLHWQGYSLSPSYQESPETDGLKTELQTEGRVNTTADQSRLYTLGFRVDPQASHSEILVLRVCVGSSLQAKWKEQAKLVAFSLQSSSPSSSFLSPEYCSYPHSFQ